jgi:hypothetical protein
MLELWLFTCWRQWMPDSFWKDSHAIF